MIYVYDIISHLSQTGIRALEEDFGENFKKKTELHFHFLCKYKTETFTQENCL